MSIFIAFGLLGIVTQITKAINLKEAASFSKVEYDSQLVPVKDAQTGYYTFYTDEDFKVVQLTDIHIGGGFMSYKKDGWAINAVANMITAEKPDLVIATGDIAYPVPFQAGTFDNKTGLKTFATVMESLGVYWTFCFGNHDTEAYSYYSSEKITKWIGEQDYQYCLYEPGENAGKAMGWGNQVINVENSKGLISRSFILMDSHSYIQGDIFGIQWWYDNIHTEQTLWYSDVINDLNIANGEAWSALSGEQITELSTDVGLSPEETQERYRVVDSIMFYHIPITEFNHAYKLYKANGYTNVDNGEKKVTWHSTKTGFGENIGENEADNPEKPWNYGAPLFIAVNDDNMYETICSVKSTQAMFFGHDHTNNFAMDFYDYESDYSVTFAYGMSIDYLAYDGISKQGYQRGCTVIETDSAGEFDFWYENYYQDKYKIYKSDNADDFTKTPGKTVEGTLIGA